MKRIMCMILAFVLVLGLLPATAMAAGKDVIYLSVSFDSNYIDDKNGNPIAYVPVSLADIEAIDLTAYGLEDMLFDADGDGEYETTALQLLIYAHEELYGGDWSEVTFDALPGSSYFRGGIFGFTENLVYFHNGDFPVDESQTSDFMTVGATSDRIVLEAGDFLDVASFSCYSFLWDQLGGFHLFANQDGSYVHDYVATAGDALTVKLKHSFCDLMYGQSWVKDAEDFEIYYGKTFGQAEGSVTTDESGNAQITFPNVGTYYIWCNGGLSEDELTHSSCDHYLETGELCVVSSPAFAKVTVEAAEGSEGPSTEPTEPETEPTTPETEPTTPETEATEPEETPRRAQDVSSVLNATLAMQAATVAEPSFGTNYGEWTVFGLARGGYYANDSKYFADYYNRIVAYVNNTAEKLNLNGALDQNKSTDNSRLIMALASIGRDATSVGNWDLVKAYSANGINWIKKQGMNGTIWALIALDCGGYETSDSTIRQQCVDAIVSAQHNDGGWSLVTSKTQPSNVDITGMTLTALYPYRNQPAVAQACEAAFAWLSESQLANGGFPYGQGETSESCVWAIVACATWGINPDTDSRFIKNGNSAVDNLLTYYLEEEAQFEHGRGAGANAMATDQATYGLIAYDRLLKGKPALYDYSDVTPVESAPSEAPTDPTDPTNPTDPTDPTDPTNPTGPADPENPDDFDPIEINASLGLPDKIENKVGNTFNAVISIDNWDNTAKLKLIDFLMIVPQGLKVTLVKAGDRLFGGELSYHLDENGNLRCVYFDANENTDLTVSGTQFPVEVFTVTFEIEEELNAESLSISIDGMSVKRSSDSADKTAMIVVGTDPVTDPDNPDAPSGGGSGNVGVVVGVSFSAVELYKGDDVDLIPSTRKAVAVAVTGITNGSKLSYNDGTNQLEFLYNAAITAKTGVSSYVALVDSAIDMGNFINENNFTIGSANAASLTFGDSNGDGVVNAQDALAAVDAWLRKGDALTDNGILTLNVNGDNRINTFDALGIVEAFVNRSTYGVVTKAAIITTNK